MKIAHIRSQPALSSHLLRQAGLTLVELMVALALGLLIISAVIAVYSATTGTYRSTEGLSRIQENARLAFDQISRDIRMADFSGCWGAQTEFRNYMTGAEPTPAGRLPMLGYNANGGSWAPVVPAGLIAVGANPINTADIITLFTTTGRAVPVLEHAAPTDPVVVPRGVNIEAGQTIAVTNCNVNVGAIFQVTSIAENNNVTPNRLILEHATGPVGALVGNATNTIGDAYQGALAEIQVFSDVVYYIALNANGIPALFRRVNGAAATEIVEGVTDLQFEYGEELAAAPGRVGQYVAADAVSDWNRVISVRVRITLRTPDTGTSTQNGGILTRNFETLISRRNI